MSKSRARRTPPFSIRFTPEERVRLERNAGHLGIALYIKSVLFAEDAPRYRARPRSPLRDHEALAEVLACLGASRIASNLNQLATAAHLGNLYFDDGTRIALSGACADIRVMRQLLMKALGVEADDQGSAQQTPSQSFARAGTPRRIAL